MTKMIFADGQSDPHWIESLRRAALKLGKSFRVMDHSALLKTTHLECELVILDADVSHDLVSIVKHIRSNAPRVRIVVVSSTPQWKQARSILLTGATDYVRKADSEDAILNMLRGGDPEIRQVGEAGK